MRAVALTVVFSLIVIVITSGLMITQSFNLSLKAKGLYTLENMLFETVSGLCTVGLTLGITPMLSVSGKILIMIAMFLGRVGPLSIGLIFLKKINSNIEEKIRYPEAAIMIG
jgi:trk system potassium uptake protein TrkH